MKQDDRRAQIVEATLELLADQPPDAISTRAIAARIGVTQPALFRHFETREDILLAVVSHTRAELADLVGGTGLVGVERLVRGLAAYATRYPGLPRLLFADVVGGGDVRLAAALTGLVASQRALIGALVAQAAPEVDADVAARLLVAGLQGILIQARREGRPADVDALLTMWKAGIASGEPAKRARVQGEAEVELDVRSLLAEGIDPLPTILAARGRLAPGGTLRVTAPFRPVPLEAVLQGLGMTVTVAQAGAAWTLTAVAPR